MWTGHRKNNLFQAEEPNINMFYVRSGKTNELLVQ